MILTISPRIFLLPPICTATTSNSSVITCTSPYHSNNIFQEINQMFNSITLYGFSGKYEFGYGVDHKGVDRVEVRFDKESDANFLLNHENPGQGFESP
jgi:hypothetical protein